ncbi:uncharacterized protein PHACADRAFT_263861 [Phanerochaete carnosa HHB-10118-sp]|uniref:Uncharacterized protein n=1 Tax=Phanerochaete carnosa (strain HHB-10118-sp) TaxID=650164 RepID=K5VVC9_PHACS|nr:uncharacterized protein PHACADRAFT_263861 [Phanerochaete carnosa HHB-10118-sp]EKM50529.1 hypothetical protein PHACADRAFT_263861 [Phanerochaete carnosa HHB-10118-sp]
MIYMMVVRARRRQPLLPGPNGGFIRVNRPPETATVPGVGYNYNNTSAYNNEGPYQPPAGDPPEQQAPPPYPGKETYPGQQSAAAAPNAPQPGGFASPPGPPPAAHVNNASPRNNRFGWFKAN